MHLCTHILQAKPEEELHSLIKYVLSARIKVCRIYFIILFKLLPYPTHLFHKLMCEVLYSFFCFFTMTLRIFHRDSGTRFKILIRFA